MDRRVQLVVMLVVVLGGLVVAESYAGQSSDGAVLEEVTVVESVLDGDTVVVESGERVRLLGLDATETGEPYAEEAMERLAELVEEQTVTLVAIGDARDRYDRLLRYIYVDGVNVNRLLVEEGLATVYYPAGPDQYMEAFQAAEGEARERGMYLWERSPAADCITITAFHWDAPGDDRFNMNGENVTFRNRCDTVNMEGWTVSDAGTKRYTFPETVLVENRSVTLYSGDGIDTENKRFWDASRPVWNNDGDRLFLRDGEGTLVAHVAYGHYHE